jgi:hypothetical protein
MILRLTFVNNMPADVVVTSNQASDQPLVAGQSLQLMVEMQPGSDGIADLDIGVKQDYSRG